jgi:hypothetical protein
MLPFLLKDAVMLKDVPMVIRIAAMAAAVSEQHVVPIVAAVKGQDVVATAAAVSQKYVAPMFAAVQGQDVAAKAAAMMSCKFSF